MPDDGELTLRVDGNQLSGWKNIRVTRGVERMPSDFDIEVTERYPGDVFQVFAKPGSECEVSIGGDVVVTGYVDRYQPSMTSRSHSVRIAGRGKCQDLVDCSAYMRKLGGQINRTTAKALIEQLASLFNITVTARDGDGLQIPQFNVILTEKTWDIIERVARFSGFLAYEGTDGNLILSRVGTEMMASGFQEGLNVERAATTFGMDQRYSIYECVYAPIDTIGDLGRALNDPNARWRARVTDDTVPRFRPYVFLSEQMMNGEDIALRRANWEMARRFGRSQAVQITADSWRDSAGRLWEPNAKARVDLPSLRLPDREWVIAEVTYARSDDGTRAEVTLMPEETFSPEPTILQPFDWQVAQALQQSVRPSTNQVPGV